MQLGAVDIEAAVRRCLESAMTYLLDLALGMSAHTDEGRCCFSLLVIAPSASATTTPPPRRRSSLPAPPLLTRATTVSTGLSKAHVCLLAPDLPSWSSQRRATRLDDLVACEASPAQRLPL